MERENVIIAIANLYGWSAQQKEAIFKEEPVPVSKLLPGTKVLIVVDSEIACMGVANFDNDIAKKNISSASTPSKILRSSMRSRKCTKSEKVTLP